MKLGSSVNWYKLDAKYTLQLLNVFVQKIEPQIQLDILHYQSNKGREFVIESEEERIGYEVEFYQGLDSQGWNLDDLFKSHFPNLQRRSAFLTLYAFLEHELEKLAHKLCREYSLLAKLEDITGMGIHRSLVYMQKVAALDIDEEEKSWKKVKEINKIRNLIIHNDGQLTDHHGNAKRERNAIKQLPKYLSEKDDELMIAPGYLNYVLETFDELFHYLDKAIALRYSPTRSTKEKTILKKNKNRKK